jgi:hypothetical protein
MTEVLLAAVVSGLIAMLQHWSPWNELLGHKLPRLAAYVLGTLAIIIPACAAIVLGNLAGWLAVMTLVGCTVAAGLGTVMGYLVDVWVIERAERAALEKVEALVREKGGLDGPRE